jgi:hypothetical protein
MGVDVLDLSPHLNPPPPWGEETIFWLNWGIRFRVIPMAKYSHQFVETYRGPVAVGLSREIDEASLVVYLQKFSSDQLMDLLRARLSDEEIRHTTEWISDLLRKHLTHEEYHRLFLGEE